MAQVGNFEPDVVVSQVKQQWLIWDGLSLTQIFVSESPKGKMFLCVCTCVVDSAILAEFYQTTGCTLIKLSGSDH